MASRHWILIIIKRIRRTGKINSIFENIQLIQILLIMAAIAAAIILLIILIRDRLPVPVRIESRIRRRRYMSQEDFFRSWARYKNDFPGCYVVLIYDKRLVFNPMNYDDIYVGQSVNVRKRVFSHLKGHGNGDVYYGLRSGCKIYVIITKCSRKKLNRTEKELIGHFNATSSLNMTRGGSARRK